MFTHTAPFPMRRVSIIALALLALAVFGALSVLPRIQVTASNPAPAMQQIAPTRVATQSQSVGCGSGAYVTGDLAGDASPSSVYAAMCGR
jgi:hypothetical protein